MNWNDETFQAAQHMASYTFFEQGDGLENIHLHLIRFF